MNRITRYLGITLLLKLSLSVAGVWAQQPMGAEPQGPSHGVQTPQEVVAVQSVPRLVKFAGTLKDGQGKPRTGAVGVTLAIYTEQEGGAALWLETQNVEFDEQGRYTVLLGATKSEGLPLELFTTGEPRWLGVQVNLAKEVEQPRVLLVSVPYALKAADADTVGGLPASAFVLAGSSGTASVMNTSGTTTSANAKTAGAATAIAANFIPVFTDNTGTLGSSAIFQSGTNIGVGTTTPAAALHVNGDTLLVTSATTAQLQFSGTASEARFGEDGNGAFFASDTPGRAVRFYTNNGTLNEGLRVTSAGNVGIGTAVPGQKLEVAGNLKISGGGSALVFPDGTVMTSAGAGTNGGTITGVTAGTGLTGGGTAGGVTLAINPSVVAQLGVASNTFTGSITASSFSGVGSGLTGVNAMTAASFTGTLAGEVTGTQGTTVVSNAVPFNTPSAIVRRDGTGNFAAGSIALVGNLAIPSTSANGTTGVITVGGTSFLHNFGSGNTFVGASAGNTTMDPVNGSANTAVGTSALTSNTTGCQNAAFGYHALSANTTACLNSAFGAFALSATTAGNNAAFGTGALSANTTGAQNAAFGSGALQSNTTASHNSAFGLGSLLSNTTGSPNDAFGSGALQSNTTGTDNAGFGELALFSNTTGFNNAAFGESALQNNTLGAGNSAFGYLALNANTTQFNNSAFGTQTLQMNTAGVDNAAFGAFALQANTTAIDNSAFGRGALQSNTTGAGNSAFGFLALNSLTSGNGNTAIGQLAGSKLSGGENNNIYIGNVGVSGESNTIRIGDPTVQTATYIAGMVNSSGQETFTAAPSGTGVGQGSLYINPGSANAGQTLLGAAVGGVQEMLLSSSGNLSLAGSLALPNTSSATVGVVTLGGLSFLHNFGTSNTFVGAAAGNMSTNLTGSSNTGVGTFALFANTTGNFNSALGYQALSANTTGSSNAAFGGDALLFNQTGSNNSAFGTGALQVNTAGVQNSAFGTSALTSSTASGNSAFGYAAMSANSTGADNAAFGVNALAANTTGIENAAFGRGSLAANTTAGSNSAFGYRALFSNTTINPGDGVSNSAFGHLALSANTTGTQNSAFGDQALQNSTTPINNSAFGYRALLSAAGGFNSAFGSFALPVNTTGVGNSALGFEALGSATGNNNIAIGTDAGFNLTTGDNNIYIGNLGAVESNAIRLGVEGTQTATFIAGIDSSPISGTAVVVNSNGRLGFLPSSRRFKHQIADMGAESDLLMKLRPVAFYYNPELDETQARQYGLVAEEVAQIAPQLVVYDKDGAPQTVRYNFVNAMLLNEVQKQRTFIVSQESKIQDLEARLAKLEAAIAGR